MQTEAFPMLIEGAALYQVHDNGGRPFTVLVDGAGPNRVRLYRTRTIKDGEGFPVPCELSEYKANPPRADELIIQWENLEKVWAAKCPSLYADESESLGNALLLGLDKSGSQHRYIHIGCNVFLFHTTDPITDFESPIDNNDVPYPAALSASEAFFLAEQVRMPRSLIRKVDFDSLVDKLKRMPAEALPWILFYETLYGAEEERREWLKKGFNFHPESRPLLGYKELVARP